MSRIQNRAELLGSVDTARDRARRELALDLFDAALEAVDPHVCTRRAIDELTSKGALPKRVHVIAFGKASRGMAEAALEKLDVSSGIVIGFEEGALGPMKLFAGDHPVPSPHAPKHGSAVLSLAQSLTADDCVLVLISGGGSALLELPQAGLTLSDLQQTTRTLLGCGATIREVNAVRMELSQVKGGRLARACAPARVVNVVLSDVIGSPLSSIASGPTVPRDADAPDALAVVRRYGIEGALPPSVMQALRASSVTPSQEALPNITSVIAADNLTAQLAMVETARARGLNVVRREYYLEGEARDLAQKLMQEARGDVFVAGGEPTVTLRGKGRGGRNQELVLASEGPARRGRLVASLGTDGIDGASDHAGALLDDRVAEIGQRSGVQVDTHLQHNNSAAYFEACSGVLSTGRTGTNVADVFVAID